MAKKVSAGILLFRFNAKSFEVLLVHPGGPFWKNKDDGAWSIPKGEADEGEDLLSVAKKEFKEETGSAIDGVFYQLQPVQLKSGKIIHAWAVKGDLDASAIISNTFTMMWPPGSGKMIEIAEIDKAGWFEPAMARLKLNPAQVKFIVQLEERLKHLPSA